MINTDTAGANNKKLEDLLKKISDPEVKEESWKQVDGILNYKFVAKVLGELPEEKHEEFMEIFIENPEDEEKIFGYLEENAGEGIRKEMTKFMSDLSMELTRDLSPDKEVSVETSLEGKPPIK